MKKLHIAGIVFVGLGIVSYLTTSDEDKAERAGFSSVAAYETAIDAGFDTKAEYDASLEQQRLIAQATDRGFASVAAMQDAEARGFRTAANEVEAQEAGYETKKEYSYFLQQQSLERTAERGGFASVEAMQSARSRGFFTAAAKQEAAAAGFNTKAEYDDYTQSNQQNSETSKSSQSNRTDSQCFDYSKLSGQEVFAEGFSAAACVGYMAATQQLNQDVFLQLKNQMASVANVFEETSCSTRRLTVGATGDTAQKFQDGLNVSMLNVEMMVQA